MDIAARSLPCPVTRSTYRSGESGLGSAAADVLATVTSSTTTSFTTGPGVSTVTAAQLPDLPVGPSRRMSAAHCHRNRERCRSSPLLKSLDAQACELELERDSEAGRRPVRRRALAQASDLPRTEKILVLKEIWVHGASIRLGVGWCSLRFHPAGDSREIR
jgi:hypothetical protein